MAMFKEIGQLMSLMSQGTKIKQEMENLQQRLGHVALLCELIDAGDQEVVQRDRHAVVIAELERLRSAPHHDLGELIDEEWYAVAAGDHGVAYSRPLLWVIDELFDHQRAVVLRERLQVERLDVIRIEGQRVTRGEQQQEAAERRTVDEPLHELECRGVGPMEVVDDDEEPLGVG